MILFCILSCTLLVSCGGGTITGRYTDNRGHWMPAKDSTGKIVSNIEIFDSVYKTEPYFSQKVSIAKHDGTLWIAIVFGALCLALLIFGFIQTTKPQKNDYILLLWPLLSIICGIIAVSSINWASTKEMAIPKITYDSVMKADGNLKKWLDTQIYK